MAGEESELGKDGGREGGNEAGDCSVARSVGLPFVSRHFSPPAIPFPPPVSFRRK